MMTLIRELRRRSVIKVGIAYAVVSWLLIQIVVSIEAPLRLPDWADTLVIVLLAAGFPVAIVMAWAFDVTPDGVRRATRVRNRETVGSPSVTEDKPSIAVLPFADMSADKDQEYFADGMTEELLNSLARIREIRVAGRTSSFYYKGKNEGLRSIGNALGVRYLLEGSIRKSGDRLRITAQLIDARSDAHIWSETFDRTFDDLFQIQEDIARSVAEALQITLGVGGLAKVPGMTRDVRAYEEYLKANVKQGVDIVMPTSEEAYRSAVQCLERAVNIDPDFSLAWVGLHFLYHQSVSFFAGGLPDAHALGERAREKSLDLTPDSPFVLSNLYLNEVQRWNWLEGERLHQRAIDAARKHGVEDHFSFRAANFYHMVGRIDEAIGWYERARIADPLNAFSAAYLSDAYLSIGEPGKAMDEVDRFVEFNGPQFVLVKASGLMAAMVADDRTEMEKRIAHLMESEPFTFLTVIMRDRLDDREAAVAELYRILKEPRSQSPFMKNIVAIWATYWGENELALKLLCEFLRAKTTTGTLVFLVWREVYRDMRRLPGFRQLLVDIGLVDYWRQSGNWGRFCRPTGDDDFECS